MNPNDHLIEPFGSVIADLAARATWEERQRLYYEMRYFGLPRKNRADWQADLHYPLADSVIEKLKPFYIQAIFGAETLAQFVQLREGADPTFAQLNAYWTDWKIKQESNFEDEVYSLVDFMLMAGPAVHGIFWNSEIRQLVYDAMDPVFIVVPYWTKSLEKVPRFTRIRTMSLDTYQLDTRFNQDREYIECIKGRGGSAERDFLNKMATIYNREGITFGSDDQEMILFETYLLQEDGRYNITTYSPMKPDVPTRDPFFLAYEHHRTGKPLFPYVEFFYERTDKGFYSPRGVPEIVSTFESYLCKTWNEKADAMTFYNRPILAAAGAGGRVRNAQSIRLAPGQVLEGSQKVERIDMGQPGISFDQEMLNTRMIAEARIGTPDFGVGNQLNMEQRKTATEVERIAALVNQQTDLRMRLFRHSLAKVYGISYSLLKQFDSQSLTFFYQDEVQRLPNEALHGDYLIQPNGSADNFNKQLVLLKANARWQKYLNNPNIRQDELVKADLEADDPRLVKRLFVETGQAKMDAMEEQAKEILLMKEGFPVHVKPQDDDQAHVESIFGFVQSQAARNIPPEPMLVQLLGNHMMEHVAQAKKKNPALGAQLEAKVKMAFAPKQELEVQAA